MHLIILLSTLFLTISPVLPAPAPVVNNYGTDAANGATPQPGEAATLASEAAAAASSAAAAAAAQQAQCGAQANTDPNAQNSSAGGPTIVGAGQCGFTIAQGNVRHF